MAPFKIGPRCVYLRGRALYIMKLAGRFCLFTGLQIKFCPKIKLKILITKIKRDKDRIEQKKRKLEKKDNDRKERQRREIKIQKRDKVIEERER